MLIDQSMGVEFHHVNSPYMVLFHVIYQWLRNIDWRKMKAPFFIPSFGSSATCALGYFNGMLELKKQIDAGECPEPDYIFITAGTGGTMAGIESAARVLGMETKVVGVRIADWIACNETLVASIVNRCYRLLRKSGADIPRFRSKGSDITMIHDFFGGEYARITPEGLKARDMAKQLDDIILDTTYTAKTMAAMIKYLSENDLKDKTVLFWHTFNSRELTPFLSPECSPEKLPGEFHKYFQTEKSPASTGRSPGSDVKT
jgi:1-aminocyclopropane-1-carboxylate deaminase/D-cysteine desulfhydrase-like pyridoxal-dependent ACC family enzyme